MDYRFSRRNYFIKTLMALVLACLVTICEANGSDWMPVLTPESQRRYGSSGSQNNYENPKSVAAPVIFPDEGSRTTTAKKQYGGNENVPSDGYRYGENKDVTATNVGFRNENYRFFADDAAHQRRPPAALIYGMGANINSYSPGLSVPVQAGYHFSHRTAAATAAPPHHHFGNDASHHATADGGFRGGTSSHDGASGNHGYRSDTGGFGAGNFGNPYSVKEMHIVNHYSGAPGYGATSVTTYRGTTGGVGAMNYGTSNMNRNNYNNNNINIFDQNRNHNFVEGYRNNGNGGSITMTRNNHNYDANNNYGGNVKGNGYSNNDGTNYRHINSNGAGSGPHFSMGNKEQNNQILNSNNNNNNNNNNYNDEYVGVPRHNNQNVPLGGTFHNNIHNNNAGVDNYIDGPKPVPAKEPPRPVQPPFPMQQAASPSRPLVPPHRPNKPSPPSPPLPQPPPPPHHPQQIRFNDKPFQEVSRPHQVLFPPPTTTAPALRPPSPMPPQQLHHPPVKPQHHSQSHAPLQLPPAQPQHVITPQRPLHPAPVAPLPPHHVRPQINSNANFVQDDPNGINDPFFQQLMKVVTNTLYYGDLEFKRS